MLKPQLIQGGSFADERGELRFVNDFNLSKVVRFYQVSHPSTDTVRAWQGHQYEQKWFYCLSGSFLVNLVEIDNWEKPSLELKAHTFELKADNPTVLHIPGGFANGFKALEENSVLMVYSNKSLKDSEKDSYRFDLSNWFNWNTLCYE